MNSEYIGLSGRDWDGILSTRADPWRIEPAAAMLRRWRLVITFAVIGSVLALLICRMLTPLYTSSAAILIDPREQLRTATSTDPMGFVPTTEEAVRKNDIAIIRSRNLAEAVIARLHLDQLPEFNRPPSTPAWLTTLVTQFYATEDWVLSRIGLAPNAPQVFARTPDQIRQDIVVDRFFRRLVTTATAASRVIDIRFRSEDPQRAAAIANAVADQYIQAKRNVEIANANATSAALQPEVTALNIKIRDAEREIENMRRDRGELPAADLPVLTERLSELNKQLAAAAGDRAAAEARLANAEAARTASDVSSFTAVLGSPLIQRLEAEAAEQAAKVAGLKERYPPRYPVVMEAQAELNALQDRIHGQVERIAVSFRNELALVRAKETGLRQALETTKEEIAKAAQSDVDIRSAERAVGTNRALLTQLVNRLSETRARASWEEPTARVISSGTVPRFPSFPPTLAVVAVAFVLSATAGGMLAMLLERRDHSVRTAGQLRHLSSHRVLGGVPALRGAWRGRGLPAARVLADSRSAFAENLRAIWLQIDRSRQQRTRTLLVTSAMPGEGKTSLATALVRLLAASGRSAIIIDADLRDPSVHGVLGLQRSPGLAEVIEGKQSLQDAVQQDHASGAAVLAAGVTSRSPVDLLQMDGMTRVLSALAAQYDVVIIDTPPILSVPDAGILAGQVDMTALAVRWGATKAGSVATTLQWLADLNAQVGVVLTMVDWEKYANYGYPYGEVLTPQIKGP